MSLEGRSVAVVIPCYQVGRHIRAVLQTVPSWVDLVIAVDDASTDDTRKVLEELAEEEPRLRLLTHQVNQGVGGAMITGFQEALRAGAELIVKIDGDGQMDTRELPRLLQPLLDGRADYAKGNRFLSFQELRDMPKSRFFGNVALTFLTKAASGCWHIFDVQNGYLALSRKVLRSLPLDRLERGYCFENSLLVHVAIRDFAVIDVPIPAIYGDETSHLRIGRVLLGFPGKLLRLMFVRLFMRYVLYDLSPVAIYLFASLPLFLFSLIFGGYHWWSSVVTDKPATTGTVVLALLTFLMAFNLLLHAINLDIHNSPRPRPGWLPGAPRESPEAGAADEAESPRDGSPDGRGAEP